MSFAVLCTRASIEAAASPGKAPGVWWPGIGSDVDHAQRAAVDAIAGRLGLDVIDAPWRADEPGAPHWQREDELLLRAGHLATNLGFGRVCWCAHPGSPTGSGPREPGDADAVGAVLDRALLVTRLLAVAARERGVVINAPVADLSDWQLADLAADLEAPVDRCWWWSGTSGEAATERARWASTLREVGWAGLVGR